MRAGCPVDCKTITYKNKISTARFLHNPMIGIEPAILNSSVSQHGTLTTEGHILHLWKKLEGLDEKTKREVLDKHIE